MRHNLRLYRAEQVRALDALAIQQAGVTGYTLMQRAGECVWRILRARWPECRSVTVCCGGGNNGGDGWVVAKLALEAGCEVQVITTTAPDALQAEAAEAYVAWEQLPRAPDWQLASEASKLNGEVIVDALLGTGLAGDLTTTMAQLIEQINASSAPKISVDIPSGLIADTGVVNGACVKADVTVSFVAQKCGMFTGEAGRFAGQLIFSDLGMGQWVDTALEPEAYLMSLDDLKAIPGRAIDAHKGQCGRVAVVGGASGMVGAPILCGWAALNAGSGLVTVMGSEELGASAMACSPALMTSVLSQDTQLAGRIAGQDVVALGPGLGQSDWALALVHQALKVNARWVWDADALNLLARHRLMRQAPQAEWILTPHPAEAARLLNIEVQAVARDRFGAARALAERYRSVIVLKGFGSLVASPEGQMWVCPYGTPAMASAGMGDALTGIIASLWGQGLSAHQAAKLGVLIHALSGQHAAQGRRQITSPDLISTIGEVMRLSD